MHALPATSTLARFTVPAGEADFQSLTAKGREDLRRKLGILGRVAKAGPGRLVQAMEAEAAAAGIGMGTVRGWWYVLEEAGGDWRALINKARLRGRQGKSLPAAFIEEFRLRCLENKRNLGNKSAWHELVEDWKAGKPIPGYGSWRDLFPDRKVCPARLPVGWSYKNLLRHAPTRFELKSAREGREAARAYRPGVMRTRVGLYVGSHYVFDDLWHDHEVNVLGQMRACRPLELHSLDVYSACKIAWGLKPLFRDAPEGELKALGKRHMRFLLGMLLGGAGFHAERGTTLMVENGTAAVSDELAEMLHRLSGGKIVISRAGMNGSPAVPGMYAGRAKGNFRFKAALESLGNLIHNRMGALPGQMGPSYDRTPEELYGRERHHDALQLACLALPPELAAQIRTGFGPFEDFRRVAAGIYARINQRTDHDLEGWELAGLTVAEFTRNHGLDWEPAASIDLIECALERGAVEALLRGREDCRRVRRLSPWEVWQRGLASLSRLPGSAVAAVLGPEDNGRERAVGQDHLFTFKDKDLGPGVHAYEAHVTSEHLTGGRKQWLRAGEKFLCVANPFDLSELHVFDAQGRYWGACPRCARVSHADLDGIKAEMGHALATEAELRAPLAAHGARLMKQRRDDALHNTQVLQQAGKPGARRLPASPKPVAPAETIEVVVVDDEGEEAAALLFGGGTPKTLSTPAAPRRPDTQKTEQAEGDFLGLIL